ncbi:OLC1v1036905C1 [Oldenlandia corymbosa var. corymbosa]|uniref:OLC1v1036905C1 n=1 Tax=Oldenlandia corymbosa var. corymbosa TaxID=529605 RepID=A0AAV1CXT4_OLDCO|nr:OLC1v1036905C1 [Oldenlandia corymbosa var. corymbosa]
MEIDRIVWQKTDSGKQLQRRNTSGISFDAMVLLKIYKKKGSSSNNHVMEGKDEKAIEAPELHQAQKLPFLQNQSVNWTQSPTFEAKQVGLYNNPNYGGFNTAFCAQDQAQMTVPLQIHPRHQIVEKMEHLNLNWTTRPTLISEPIGQWPSKKDSGGMALDSHSDYGFNAGFCYQQNQPFGLKQVESIGQHLDGLLNLEIKVAEPNENQGVQVPNFSNEMEPPSTPVVTSEFGCQTPCTSSCVASETRGDRTRV